MPALVALDHAIEVRTDLVRPALLEGVAGEALLGGGGALLDVGACEQLFDRLAGSAGPFAASDGASRTAMSKPGFASFCGVKIAPAVMFMTRRKRPFREARRESC